ncbi:MAG TPA: hypothetical protein VK348_07710 [Planctomycetota bacterium]|nr:hypothetical protein [Planctomycetota bacterium]
MTIDSVSAAGNASATSFFQRINRAGVHGQRDGDGDGAGGKNRFEAAIAAAGKAMGLDDSKIQTMLADISKAVAGVGNGGSGADKRAAITNAVDAALKNDGIDPVQFKAELDKQLHAKGAHGHRHHGHKKHGGGDVAPVQASATPVGAVPTDGSTTGSPQLDLLV